MKKYEATIPYKVTKNCTIAISLSKPDLRTKSQII